MNRYKLIRRDDAEKKAVTYSDDSAIVPDVSGWADTGGGGPWAEHDDHGPLYIWVNNVIPAVTKAQKLAALDAEYDPQRRQLWDYLGLAVNFWQDQEAATSIRAELTALENEYNQKAEAIANE